MGVASLTLMTSQSVRVGMTVLSSEGEPLGQVIFCADDTFTVEKGEWVPWDYEVRFSEVAQVLDDTVQLTCSKHEILVRRAG